MACSPQRDVPRSELSELPPQSRLSKVLWAIPQLMVFGVFGFGIWATLSIESATPTAVGISLLSLPLAWACALTVTTLISSLIDLWRRLVTIAMPGPLAGKDGEPGRESQGPAAPDRGMSKLMKPLRRLRVDH